LNSTSNRDKKNGQKVAITTVHACGADVRFASFCSHCGILFNLLNLHDISVLSSAGSAISAIFQRFGFSLTLINTNETLYNVKCLQYHLLIRRE
jgi:hypothetical protein